MKQGKTLAFIVLAAAAMFPVRGFSSTYNFQTFNNPTDLTFNQLLSINDTGAIAGYYGSGMTDHPNQGYTLTTPSSFTSENFPASVQTQVTGINNNGLTVGFYIDAAGVSHGFVDNTGTFSTVDFAGAMGDQILGVNNNGIAAGFYTDALGVNHPFTYNISTMAFTPITAPDNSLATDVNNAGIVSGFTMTSMTTANGFIVAGGTTTTLQYPGSMNTMALGLNNNGEVVGVYVDAAGNMHGFTYNQTSQSYQSFDDPNGIGTTTFNGVNDLGQIVGFYVDGNMNTNGLLADPVPEPASLTLFGIGGLALLVMRRRKMA